MAVLSIDWSPDRRELRKFGLGLLVSGLIVAALAWWLGQAPTLAAIVAGVAVAGGALTTLAPRAVGLIAYRALMAPAYAIGSVVSRVLVVTFFYACITPLGLAMRPFREDPLDLGPARESYWKPADEVEPTVERYERPF